MTVDKVRPLLAFAFVACLCAGVLAAGMNRATGHRIVTETRIPATALPRESSLVLGSTLEGRRTTPPKATPTITMSRLTTPAVSTAPVTTPAVAVSAPRRDVVAQRASGAHHGGTTKPATAKPARPTKPAKPAAPTTPTAPSTTQPVTGNPKAPGQVKKTAVKARRTVTATTAPKHIRKAKSRAVQLTHFTTDLLPGATTTTGHGKGHPHAKALAKAHARAQQVTRPGRARKS